MKILLVHRYFYPDSPPYASILLEIARRLIQDGHEVEVLTSFPSYKSTSSQVKVPESETIDGIQVRRIKLLKEEKNVSIKKLINIFYFPLRVFVYLLFNRRIDSVMCSTAPAVFMGFFTALGAKLIKADFKYHCMDIHPEIGNISGEFKNPLVFKILKAMDSWTCKQAQNIIVLSSDMKASLISRCAGLTNIHEINNFALPEQEKAFEESYQNFLREKNVFRVIFAGNIGRFQNLESFIQAMKQLSSFSNIELVFVGEGSALSNLKEKANHLSLKNIKFFPHQPIFVARALMRDANLGIVSLNKDIYKYAFPSKTMTYLEEGCPILLTVESESSISDMVVKNKLGVQATPDDPHSIAEAILKMYQSNQVDSEIRKKAQQFISENFSQTDILNKWTKLFSV